MTYSSHDDVSHQHTHPMSLSAATQASAILLRIVFIFTSLHPHSPPPERHQVVFVPLDVPLEVDSPHLRHIYQTLPTSAIETTYRPVPSINLLLANVIEVLDIYIIPNCLLTHTSVKKK